jgi:hypothetical protein
MLQAHCGDARIVHRRASQPPLLQQAARASA